MGATLTRRGLEARFGAWFEEEDIGMYGKCEAAQRAALKARMDAHFNAGQLMTRAAVPMCFPVFGFSIIG